MSDSPLLVLNEAEIRSIAALDDSALAAVADGFARLARKGEVMVPPPMGIHVKERRAEIHIKTAYAKGLPGFAVKIASGFGTNKERGLPLGSGVMLLMSAETGFPMALLADNGYLTNLRTAIAGALAAKYLARGNAAVAGIVGTGVQARFQLRALRLVRGIERALVFGRRPEAAAEVASEMQAELGIPVTVAATLAELAAACDIMVTTTGAREPLVRAEHLHPGLHITAVGSDGAGKQELDEEVLVKADLIGVDLRSQSARLGELQHATPAANLDDERVVEMSALCAGTRKGRTADAQVTVCDLTGLGIQDTSIALHTYARARERGIGRTL